MPSARVQAKGSPVSPVVVSAPTPPPSVGEDDAIAQATENRMRDYFASRPKVSVRVQEDQWVQINGYTFLIKGKQRVEVPVDVADLLEASGRL